MTSFQERWRAGRQRRTEVPRSAHGEWSPLVGRPDVVAFLRDVDRGRVPSLLPLRYARMSASPLSFLRGSAALMAFDLSSTPTTGWLVQASGDAHLGNFGAFATPERELVFDLNDFDETMRAPWEWDLKRLAASIVLAGRASHVRADDCDKAVLGMARTYRTAMQRYAAVGYLEVFYSQLDSARVIEAVSRPARSDARRDFERATQHDQPGALAKLTTVVNGVPRIVDNPPLLSHVIDDDDALGHPDVALGSYQDSLPVSVREILRKYRYVDAARKEAGIGSVGMRCFIVLLVGRNRHDSLLLQIKEARPSVLEAHVGQAPFANHGERVVEGQRRSQAASDIFLGWGEYAGVHYYVRQLQDMKGSVDLSRLNAKRLATYAAVCGWALARAHARTGDPDTLAGYLGRSDAMDRAIARFGGAYADQTERDHAAFVSARLVSGPT